MRVVIHATCPYVPHGNVPQARVEILGWAILWRRREKQCGCNPTHCWWQVCNRRWRAARRIFALFPVFTNDGTIFASQPLLCGFRGIVANIHLGESSHCPIIKFVGLPREAQHFWVQWRRLATSICRAVFRALCVRQKSFNVCLVLC